MTPDELAAYCAEFGYELGEKPPANTLVRPWNNPDPLARRERVRKAEMNRIAIEQMRREKAATEAARIARLESMRKNVRHEPVGEIRAQVQRMGFDRTVIEGERAIGGLLDGITMIDPGDRMLPPPRVYGPTARDELEAAREQRRRQSSAPPPPMAGSRTYEEMLSDTLANETERPTDWSAAPPTTPPPQPVQPTTHAKNMSKEAFKALLSKFRI